MKKLFFCAFCFTLVLFLYLFSICANTKVRLSEVVSCNHTVLYDNTGTYHDYIELYNPTSHPIDISGYHLSDSKRRPNRFTFPQKTIVFPKQYYLVWAGYKPEDTLVDDNHLYTGFKLKASEKVYFSDNKGHIIDKIKIPKNLACDMSYSRLPYASKWAKRDPTPEMQNKLFNKRKTKILPNIKVEFDVPSGFYDAPFLLKMSAPKGFDIYYTTDSTTPDSKSLKYIDPIMIDDASYLPNKHSALDNLSSIWHNVPQNDIDKATIVRAVAVRKSDGATSEVSDASYFVGFQNKIGYMNVSVISLITDPENLFDYEKGIYVTGKLFDLTGQDNLLPCYLPTTNYSAEGKDWARPMSVYYTKDSKTTKLTGKFKIQGKCTRNWIQKSFTLFDLTNPSEKTAAPFEFDLRAINQIFRIKENMIYALTSDRTELLPHLPEDIVNLFLDGEFWGTYYIYKRVTPEFIAQKAGLKDPSLISMLRNKKIYGNTELKENYATYEELEQNIDVDSLISFVAINAYMSNLDTCNLLWWNLVRWKSSEKPAYNKWHWMLYDLDSDIFFAQPDPFEKNETCNLIVGNSFLENLFLFEPFRKKFIITFQDIANYNFNPQKIHQFFNDFERDYADSLVLSFQRFDAYDFSKEIYIQRIDQIKNIYDNRFNSVMPSFKKYFHLKGELTKVYKLPSSVNGGQVLLNTLKLKADEAYAGQYYSDYDISLDVQTFDGYSFQGWLIDGRLNKNQKLNLNISEPHTIEAVWTKESKQ